MYCNARPAGMSSGEDSDSYPEYHCDLNYSDEEVQERIPIERPKPVSEKIAEAVLSEDISSLKKIIESEKDEKDLNYTVLFYSASRGSVTLCQYALTLDVDLNARRNGKLALILACCSTESPEESILNVIKMFVEHGADINKTDNYGTSALMKACEIGYLDVARYLVEMDADVDAKDEMGWTSLFYAARCNRKEIAEFLISAGACCTSADKKGRKAYHIATIKGHHEVAALLNTEICIINPNTQVSTENGQEEKDQCKINENAADLLQEFDTNFSVIEEILSRIKLTTYCDLFSKNQYTLEKFLLVSDEELRELGVRFSLHRKQILAANRYHVFGEFKKFKPWTKSAESSNLEDALNLLLNTKANLCFINVAFQTLLLHHEESVKNSENVPTLLQKLYEEINLTSLSYLQLFRGIEDISRRDEPMLKRKDEMMKRVMQGSSRGYITKVILLSTGSFAFFLIFRKIFFQK